MSQPDLVSSFWSADGQLCPEPETALDDRGSDLPVASQTDDPDLLSQLAQSQALEQQRVARIYHLEQALDQALACLSDLRAQLQNQEVLEAQLATTEEFAYVQQQAIVRLKQQLVHQQHILEAHVNEAQRQNQTVQTLLLTTEAMTQAQHAELERLEAQLAKQLRLQARWQQNCQEAEAERDRYQRRTTELAQQVSEMQDQIFAQARQAGEHEAAVQHWKDRYLNSQRQMTQLKALLEQAIAQPVPSNTQLSSDTLLGVLAAIQSEISCEESEVSLSPMSRFSTLDLPDFLVRRRSYRNR